jgi:8-oxo-dGTP pyrophosphatase MutT (NUDIX family)
LPIAEDDPRFVSVVVWRHGAAGREYLVLHRQHRDWSGDWAWTNPAGARQPGEDPPVAARRELLEEAGLVLELTPVHLDRRPELAFYVAEAGDDAEVLLDHEHDAFAWVDLEEACLRCQPAMVADTFAAVDSLLRE